MSETPLADITKLGLFLGRVSEVHLKNLKSFPWIFFNGLSQVGLDYDIASTKEGVSSVSYDLAVGQENDNLPKRYQALEAAVRSLFWKDVKVAVSINGKEVFKSE